LNEQAAAPHRIHLRGPWQAAWCDENGHPLSAPIRLRHPDNWPAFVANRAGRVLLERTFHAPTNLEPHESVFVVLTGVRGEGEVRLNGQSLGKFDDRNLAYEFAVPLPLPFSNSLVIQVAFPASASDRPDVGVYGAVALEIRVTNHASTKRR
jgi:hypothetical protein